MRIAIINRDRCQPRKCSKECEYFCPPVRTGDETIVFVDGKPLITDCLLYTSDAADDLLCVDLGGRRIIKNKKTTITVYH